MVVLFSKKETFLRMIFDESPRKNKGVVTGNFFFENKSVNAIPYDC